MRRRRENASIDLVEVLTKPDRNGVENVTLRTDSGDIGCRFHPAEGSAAVLWVGGAGGGLDGPAGGLYPRLAARLVPDGIASLRLAYRYPSYLSPCVLDTLMGVSYLEGQGCNRIALVGHSFGGAVVITAGAASPAVTAVATLSSQTAGTGDAPRLSPKPLLLMHGTADKVLPDSCSQNVFSRAGQPRQLLLYPGCDHSLDQCREKVDHDLYEWLCKVLVDEKA